MLSEKQNISPGCVLLSPPPPLLSVIGTNGRDDEDEDEGCPCGIVLLCPCCPVVADEPADDEEEEGGKMSVKRNKNENKCKRERERQRVASVYLCVHRFVILIWHIRNMYWSFLLLVPRSPFTGNNNNTHKILFSFKCTCE